MTISYRPAPLLRAASRFVLCFAFAAPASAQIFKCTDASGNVTYQNEACPKNMKAGRVDIFDNSWTADRAEKEAEWRRNAASRRVVTGMPLRWVREALGEPAEIRDTPTAGAAQVWAYSFPDRNVEVGILAEQVLWVHETPVVAPLSRAPPVANPAPPGLGRDAADALRAPETQSAVPEIERSAATAPKAEAPRAIARGQDCRQALAELGRPDRQREITPPDNASDPATEYIYEPGGARAARTRVVCANGKVEGIDRSVSR